MNVLLVGYGKMGSLICQSLLKMPAVESLSVMDIRIGRVYEESGVRFLGEMSDGDIARYDAAFVATPGATHFSVTERLIRCGVRNIFVEKPAVVTMEELRRARAIRGDCRIAVGYILRQSRPAGLLRDTLRDLESRGYRMDHGSVVYEKYLPSCAEARARTDAGVLDEAVHIWDMIFNYWGLGPRGHALTQRHVAFDPERPDRPITASLTYQLHFEQYSAPLRVDSSFLAEKRRRVFTFVYRHPAGNIRSAELSFDGPEQEDRLQVTDGEGRVLQTSRAPSLVKLDRQMKQVLHFFQTGDRQELAVLDDEQVVIELLQEAECGLKK